MHLGLQCKKQGGHFDRETKGQLRQKENKSTKESTYREQEFEFAKEIVNIANTVVVEDGKHNRSVSQQLVHIEILAKRDSSSTFFKCLIFITVVIVSAVKEVSRITKKVIGCRIKKMLAQNKM